MPNLAGIFDMRSTPTDTVAAVSAFTRVLDVPGVKYTVRSWRDERFGAVNLLTGICGNTHQPATADGQIVLFLDGEVCNLAEVLQTPVNTEPDIADPTRACLELYLQNGDDFVKQLIGQFNILVYDRPNRNVKVFNDRMGYRPFYYWSADGLALFGLEKKAIFVGLGKTPPFDPTGILEFMTFGHNLDDRTIFSGIRVMPPGAVLEVGDNGACVRRYWCAAFNGKNRGISVDEAAGELGHRVCRAVRRWTRSGREYGILLSGGLDSRAAAGALARLHRHVTSFTFGPDGFPDLEYGRQLADELGFAFHRLTYDHVPLAGVLPSIVWRTEGSRSFNELLSIVQHRYIRPKAAVIFTGHHGGVLTGAHLLPTQFLVRNTRQLAEHILAKRTLLRLPTLRVIFKASFLDEVHPEMVRRLEQSLLALEEDRLPLAHSLWDITVREPRFTFCSPAVDRYVVEVVTPFTDNEVVDWMLGLPVRHLFAQKVYKRMIIRTFPEIAGVPWAKTGRPLCNSVMVDLAFLGWLFAAKRLRRLGGRARVSWAGPNFGDLRSAAAAFLALDAFPDELFDRDGIRRVTQAVLEEGATPKPFFMLLTLAECVRLFGSGGLETPPREIIPVL
ncbi:MAG: hypothetical protein JSW58_10245 [Candidatus Latescibacterota bacterium]|nr:MAG: hypothetical protein JSW58_10245 [Candidatus Latescibacterota bacterium]